MARPVMSDPEQDLRPVQTYRYLRLITLVPAIWLIVAIATEAVIHRRLLDSISDYYGGPLRDVFVGALMASAIGMIAYKGRSKLEDYALNFAGVNAFFVALVSNSFQGLLDETRETEGARASATGGVDVANSTELLENLRIGVGTFIVVLIVFVVVDNRLMRWTEFRWSEQTRLTNGLVITSWAAQIVLLAVVVAMVFGLESIGPWSIFSVIHFSAAVLLIVNLSFAAASYAFPGRLRRAPVDAPAETLTVRRIFIGITVAMWLGLLLAAALLLWTELTHVILAVEVWEILLFIAFWFVATRNEWRLRPHEAGST